MRPLHHVCRVTAMALVVAACASATEGTSTAQPLITALPRALSGDEQLAATATTNFGLALFCTVNARTARDGNVALHDRNINRARSSIRRPYGAIADHARVGGRAAACPPPTAAPRWPSGRCFPRAPDRRGDRSDALVGRTRSPNVPARDRGVGVRLSPKFCGVKQTEAVA